MAEFDYSTISDEELVKSTLANDKQLFGILIERYWRVAVAIASAKTSDFDAAQDIAQESFLKAYMQLHTLKDRGRFAGWLNKIILQESVNHCRKQPRLTLTPIDDLCLDLPAAIKSNPGLTHRQRWFIKNAVAGLPDKLRTVIIMRFVGELNASQIAFQLNKRHGTIRVWLHRAYKILQRDLSSLAEEVKV